MIVRCEIVLLGMRERTTCVVIKKYAFVVARDQKFVGERKFLYGEDAIKRR